MGKIIDKGDRIKVIRDDGDIYLYTKTELGNPSIVNQKLILKDTDGATLEELTCSDVSVPAHASCNDLLDAVYSIIYAASTTEALDGFIEYLSVDLTLPNSAVVTISSSSYFRYVLFDDTIEEEMRIGITVPPDFDASINPEIWFNVAPADNQDTISSKTFKFQGEMKYVSENENRNKAIDETVTAVVVASTLYGTISRGKLTLDASKMKAGDFIGMRFSRLATDPQDNRNSDAEVSSMTFRYKKL